MEQEKLKILAVEDNPADLRLLEEYLKEGLAKEFELIRAETIKEALKILTKAKVDIVFLDLGLPDSVGLDGIERLNRANPNLPVIVLTGLDDEKTGIFALSKNAQDYLVKGKIESKSLVKSIRFAIERKHVETILKNSEEKLKAIFESSPAGIVLLDLEGKIIEVNNAAVALHGALSKRVLIGKNCFRFIDKIHHAKAKREWEKVLLRSSVVDVELTLLAKGQRRFDALLSATVLKDNAGQPRSFLVVINDITKRKQTENLLRQSQKDLARAQAVSHVGSWRFDVEGNEFVWSEEGCRILEIPYGMSLTYNDFISIVYPEDRKFVSKQWQLALTGKPYDVEYRIFVEGSIKWIREKATFQFDKQGRFAEGFGTIQDITELKVSQERVIHLASFPKFSPNPIIELNTVGEIVYINPAVSQALKRANKAGKVELFLPYDFKNILRTLLQEKEKLFIREINIGTAVFMETINTIPKLNAVRIYAQDITARKIAEGILRKTRNYLESLLQYANAPIVVWDKGLRISLFNHAFEVISGYSTSEVMGKDVGMLFPDAAKKELIKRTEKMLKGRHWDSLEIPILCKDKTLRLCIWNSSNIYDENNHTIVSTIAQGQDITERKRMENELRWTEQYNSILSDTAASLLAAGNPQTVINKVCKKAMKFLDCHIFFNFMVVPGKEQLRINSYAGISKKEAKQIKQLDYGSAVCGYVALHGKRFIAEEIFKKNDPRTKLVRGYGVRAYCCHPLQIGRETLGTLSFGTKNRDHFTQNEILMMKALADLIAVGMQRKRASDAIKKINKELEVRVKERTLDLAKANVRLNKELTERIKTEKFIRITNALLKLADRSHDKKEYVRVVLRLMKSWAKGECSGIRLIDQEKRIAFEAHIGYGHSFMNSESILSLVTDNCACTRVITEKYLACDKKITTKKGSFFINDSKKFMAALSKKDKDNFRGVCMGEGFRSLAVIPIRYKNVPIAAIHLADRRKNIFPADKIEFLEALMPFVGEGIQKFTLAEKVERSSELLEKIFATTNFMVAYLDKEFNFIRVNNAYALADGKTPEFFAGKNIFALYPDQENEKIFKRVIERGASDSMFARPFLYEKNYEHGVAYCDWNIQPVKDSTGNVEGVILFLVDITKRKQAEEELLKTQKELNDAKRLSDIGTLAATVAHELRNPLAAMRMAAYNIKAKRTNPDLDKHITNIEKKIVESDQIINNLLFYSRLKISSYQKIKIKDILEECIGHIRPQSEKNNIELRASIADIVIEADPLQMSELFHNILNNAYDALVLKERQGKIEMTADVFNEGFLKVAVSDNGVGISKESLKRMYEPFFTTKAKGTGLGLTVCYQIVNLHKGKIDIESEENKGTVVTVIIPLAQ